MRLLHVFAGMALSACALAQESQLFRLPDTVTPTAYTLDLNIDPKRETYSGTIRIDVRVSQRTDTVHLHAVDLDFKAVHVAGQSATRVASGFEMAGLRVPRDIDPGPARIEIAFEGKFEALATRGLFRQKSGSDWYVYSHFEPTDARRAFPCFDEPGFKVPWTITIRAPKETQAFSNAPELRSTVDAGDLVTHFQKTKPLPTYLVALAVGRFDVIELGKLGRNRTSVRTIVPRGGGAATGWFNAATKKALPALEEFFGSAYPFEKLDQIAIPQTVSFGAMESPGLITYNQYSVLLGEEQPVMVVQQYVANVIAHEISHQWFGNMVTPMWWDDLWLNEAFATWVARKMTARLYPDWRVEVTSLGDKYRVMQLDTLESARRIRRTVNDRNDLAGTFDALTYQKGSAVIEMFENYVGKEQFRRGLQRYLAKHRWGNATAGEFLSAISPGGAIAPAFSTFLDRTGPPLVSVDLRCSGSGAKLSVTQERLAPLGSTADSKQFWQVPICVRAGNSTGQPVCALIRDPKQEVPLAPNSDGCPSWLNANANGAGYYAVLYSTELLQRLLANVESLTAVERLDFYRNAQLLLRAGMLPVRDALALFRKAGRSDEPASLAAAAELAMDLRLVAPEAMRPQFAQIVREVLGDKVRAIGWEVKPTDSPEVRNLRTGLLSAFAVAGMDRATAEEARKLTGAWLKDSSAVSPDVIAPALIIAPRTADATLVGQYREAWLRKQSPTDRIILAVGLGHFGDAAAAKAALGLLFDPEIDPRALLLILEVYRNDLERSHFLWEFVRDDYEALSKRIPPEAQARVIEVLGGLCSNEDGEAFGRFYQTRASKIEGGEIALRQAMESIRLCTARREKQSAELTEALR